MKDNDYDYLMPLFNKVRNDTIFETIKRLFEEIDWSSDTKEFEKNMINLLDKYSILGRSYEEQK